MKLRVAGDLVFLRPEKLPSRSEAGLHLIHERDTSVCCGEVVAVGEGPRSANGTLLPHHVRIGDRVIFAPESYQEVQFQKETILAMAEDDILAIIDEEAVGAA